MSEIKDQEAEVKACEACAEEAEKKVAAAEETAAEAEAPAVDEAAKAAAKKKIAMIVRCVIWGIVLIGVVCFFIFKNDIMECIRRSKRIEQITNSCKEDLGIAPFSVKYIGENKYEVIFKDPAKLKKVEQTLNKVVYVYDAAKDELTLAESDSATWAVLKQQYIIKNRKKSAAPAEAPAAEKPAEPAKK